MITSGIYGIFNTVTTTVYIGSSRDISRRWVDHRKTLNNGSHRNRYLLRAWRKYGPKAFEFHILEECVPTTLIEREISWMRFLKPAYNMNIPDLDMEGFIVSDETRKLIGEKNRRRSPDVYQKVRDALSGRPKSETHRKNISDAKKGKKPNLSPDARFKIGSAKRGKQTSEETRRRLSEAAKLREQRIRDGKT